MQFCIRSFLIHLGYFLESILQKSPNERIHVFGMQLRFHDNCSRDAYIFPVSSLTNLRWLFASVLHQLKKMIEVINERLLKSIRLFKPQIKLTLKMHFKGFTL